MRCCRYDCVWFKLIAVCHGLRLQTLDCLLRLVKVLRSLGLRYIGFCSVFVLSRETIAWFLGCYLVEYLQLLINVTFLICIVVGLVWCVLQFVCSIELILVTFGVVWVFGLSWVLFGTDIFV